VADSGSPLESWYRDHGRHELPWRATRDRWAVLVSEVMLHQTQASRVEVAWPSFIAEFPTPAAMAAATPSLTSRLMRMRRYSIFRTSM